jgi:Protein of unknown function (DUF2934)
MDTQIYDSHSQPQNSEFKTRIDASAETSQEHREHMIAEAAYYIAVDRQFQNGDPTHDWLQAQTVIDNKIKGNNI